MSSIIYDYTEEYIKNLIPERSGTLKEMEDFAHQNHVPIVQKDTAKFLEFMTSLKKPKKILELGTAIGFSSVLMYISSGTEPEIVTIERDPEMIELAKKNLSNLGLDKKITIREGDCLEVLKTLKDSFDLIFVDAGKGHYNHFLPECLRLLASDGIIIADNVLFRGMVATDELVKRRKITIVKRMRNYLDLVNSNQDLITSVIPIGDGIAVTKRK